MHSPQSTPHLEAARLHATPLRILRLDENLEVARLRASALRVLVNLRLGRAAAAEVACGAPIPEHPAAAAEPASAAETPLPRPADGALAAETPLPRPADGALAEETAARCGSTIFTSDINGFEHTDTTPLDWPDAGSDSDDDGAIKYSSPIFNSGIAIPQRRSADIFELSFGNTEAWETNHFDQDPITEPPEPLRPPLAFRQLAPLPPAPPAAAAPPPPPPAGGGGDFSVDEQTLIDRIKNACSELGRGANRDTDIFCDCRGDCKAKTCTCRNAGKKCGPLCGCPDFTGLKLRTPAIRSIKRLRRCPLATSVLSFKGVGQGKECKACLNV